MLDLFDLAMHGKPGENHVAVIQEDFRQMMTRYELNKLGEEVEVIRPLRLFEELGHNLILDPGRKAVLTERFNLGAAPSPVAYGCWGSDNTAVDATDTRLGSELIAGTTRPSLTDAAGGSLDNTDITSEVSGSDRWKLVVMFKYASTDPNDGSTVGEAGLIDTAACPGTPTGTSGILFAHYALADTFIKATGTAVAFQWTVRT